MKIVIFACLALAGCTVHGPMAPDCPAVTIYASVADSVVQADSVVYGCNR